MRTPTNKLNCAETVLRRAQNLVEISHDNPTDSEKFLAELSKLEIALEKLGEFELKLIKVNLSKTFGE